MYARLLHTLSHPCSGAQSRPSTQRIRCRYTLTPDPERVGPRRVVQYLTVPVPPGYDGYRVETETEEDTEKRTGKKRSVSIASNDVFFRSC